MIYHNKKFTGGLDGFYFIRRKNPVNSDLKGWPNDKYGIYNLSFNYEPRKDFNFYLKINNISINFGRSIQMSSGATIRREHGIPCQGAHGCSA